MSRLTVTAEQALARAGASLGRIGLPQPWCTWGRRTTSQDQGNTNDCCYAATYWLKDDGGHARSDLRNGSIRALRADRDWPELGFGSRNLTAGGLLRLGVRPGDLVCMRWEPGTGDNLPDHVGIVVRVNRDGTVLTREANTGPRPGVSKPCGVHERTRQPGQIAGFIRPPYAKAGGQSHDAPAKVTHYVVRDDDTLSGIGERLGIDWHRIAEKNRIAGPNYVIHPGQKLDL